MPLSTLQGKINNMFERNQFSGQVHLAGMFLHTS